MIFRRGPDTLHPPTPPPPPPGSEHDVNALDRLIMDVGNGLDTDFKLVLFFQCAHFGCVFQWLLSCIWTKHGWIISAFAWLHLDVNYNYSKRLGVSYIVWNIDFHNLSVRAVYFRLVWDFTDAQTKMWTINIQMCRCNHMCITHKCKPLGSE